MQKGRLPRILIVTAGYGEGHNSAARGVRDALAGRAEVLVTDLCAGGDAPDVWPDARPPTCG